MARKKINLEKEGVYPIYKEGWNNSREKILKDIKEREPIVLDDAVLVIKAIIRKGKIKWQEKLKSF